MKEKCGHCGRPINDDWVAYCPISRELAEMMRSPDGLTSKHPVTMRLEVDDTITVTEHYPEHSDGSGCDR